MERFSSGGRFVVEIDAGEFVCVVGLWEVGTWYNNDGGRDRRVLSRFVINFEIPYSLAQINSALKAQNILQTKSTKVHFVR